ncbi:MAG: hypothetical protein HYR56_05090 [Acidobacteria bacterium]|nr:hypothetical protein [Acidobacteriota bacterium]MBI3427666.1 hypothetical protein [Acidobacteriota bacterium]
MRNRIFGVIGVIWGAGILISHFTRGRVSESSGAYASGQLAGVVLGGLLFTVGLYFLVKGSKK